MNPESVTDKNGRQDKNGKELPGKRHLWKENSQLTSYFGLNGYA